MFDLNKQSGLSKSVKEHILQFFLADETVGICVPLREGCQDFPQKRNKTFRCWKIKHGWCIYKCFKRNGYVGCWKLCNPKQSWCLMLILNIDANVKNRHYCNSGSVYALMTFFFQGIFFVEGSHPRISSLSFQSFEPVIACLHNFLVSLSYFNFFPSPMAAQIKAPTTKVTNFKQLRSLEPKEGCTLRSKTSTPPVMKTYDSWQLS